jgi:hypothetical protein
MRTPLLLLSLLLIAGCDTREKSPLPLRPKSDAIVSEAGETIVRSHVYLQPSQIPSAFGAVQVNAAGLVWAEIETKTVIEKDPIHLTTVRRSYFRVLCVCDFPMNMYGPPSPGHGWEDGHGCSPMIDGGGDGGWTLVQGNGDAADADGTPIRAIQGTPSPQKGDPTSDD